MRTVRRKMMVSALIVTMSVAGSNVITNRSVSAGIDTTITQGTYQIPVALWHETKDQESMADEAILKFDLSALALVEENDSQNSDGDSGAVVPEQDGTEEDAEESTAEESTTEEESVMEEGVYELQLNIWKESEDTASMTDLCVDDIARVVVKDREYTIYIYTSPLTLGAMTASVEGIKIVDPSGETVNAVAKAYDSDGTVSCYSFTVTQLQEIYEATVNAGLALPGHDALPIRIKLTLDSLAEIDEQTDVTISPIEKEDSEDQKETETDSDSEQVETDSDKVEGDSDKVEGDSETGTIEDDKSSSANKPGTKPEGGSNQEENGSGQIDLSSSGNSSLEESKTELNSSKDSQVVGESSVQLLGTQTGNNQSTVTMSQNLTGETSEGDEQELEETSIVEDSIVEELEEDREEKIEDDETTEYDQQENAELEESDDDESVEESEEVVKDTTQKKGISIVSLLLRITAILSVGTMAGLYASDYFKKKKGTK